MYFVAYQPTGQAAGAESTVINTTDSKVVIDDLDSTTEYTFTLDVGTAGGKSALAAGNFVLPVCTSFLLPCINLLYVYLFDALKQQ